MRIQKGKNEQDNKGSNTGSAGAGLMEVIIWVLAVLILASIFVHFIRLGIAAYKLKDSSNEVATELRRARESALKTKRNTSVIFESESGRFGIDNNNDGRLQQVEAELLPDGLTFSEDTVVVFLASGELPAKAAKPRITVSNQRDSKNISVSSFGSVLVE